MLFYKILQMFLLPSIFIFLFLLLGLIFIFLKRKKTGRILLIIGLAFFYLFSITPAADLILAPLENQYAEIKETQLDSANIIVLLMGGIKNKELPKTSALSESTMFRTAEALRIYFAKKENHPQIIISGNNPLSPETKEALLVSEFMESLGVSEEDIILENESRNTLESSKEVKEIVKNEPFFLITSSYHLPRSMESFQRQGMNPFPAPADFKREGDYNLFDFFPWPENLHKFNLAFHEYFGILFYRLIL